MREEFTPGMVAEHDQWLAAAKDNLSVIVSLAKAHKRDPKCPSTCVGASAMLAYEALDDAQQRLVTFQAFHDLAHATPPAPLSEVEAQRAIWQGELAQVDFLIASAQDSLDKFKALSQPMLEFVSPERKAHHPVVVAEAEARIAAYRVFRERYVKNLEDLA